MKKTIILVVFGLLLGGGVITWTFAPLGNKVLPETYWQSYENAKISFDSWGIPSIEGKNWEAIIKAQGFVVASERLWQMDLLRRKAGGRLSEWFGEKAFEHDKANQSEDRIAVANAAASMLPRAEKQICDLYAEGVNRFIKQHPQNWSIEYWLLDTSPQKWSCTDTLLILLEMADQLTSAEKTKLKANAWQQYLPESWVHFLYPQNHRWNQPLFGEKKAVAVEIPDKKYWLKPYKLTGQVIKPVSIDPTYALGSNNWAYHSEKGSFVVNDPHLRHSIPSIWFLNRLRVSKDDWLVGSSVPGIPGVILGMNPAVAWSFTNTGEDVDDLLEESLNEDQTAYQDWDHEGQAIWIPLKEKEFTIKVKGEDEPRKFVAKFTHRGPLKQDPYHQDQFYSRQWLALKPESLRLPIKKLITMRTLDEVHSAFDDLSIPSQNILLIDRQGEITYRTSGTGIIRANSLKTPKVQDALDGEWLGFAQASERMRLTIPVSGKPSFLATANERVWVDHHFHHWFPDDRKKRIKHILGQEQALGYRQMEALQLDTHSQFRKLFVQWIAKSINTTDPKRSKFANKLIHWDGTSRSDSLLFQQANVAEEALDELLIRRILNTYMPKDFTVPFNSRMKRAWKLELLLSEHGFAAFGLDNQELAHYLLERMLEESTPHHERNIWKVQHPFVNNVPILGQYFAIKEFPQWGAFDTVNAEQQEIGPSVRLIWNMSKPWESTWILPVGQSGHPESAHYDSMQELWHRGERIKVFPNQESWF